MKSFEEIGTKIGQLLAEKNRAYGDSFAKSGEIMRTWYPNGVPPEKLDDALTLIRIVDKMFRIATNRDAFGEDPWQDIAGYAILAHRRRLMEREKQGSAIAEKSDGGFGGVMKQVMGETYAENSEKVGA